MKIFKRRCFSILIVTLIINITHSHVTLKPDKLLRVPIRCDGLTRIKIQGDKIQDVVVHPSKMKYRVTLHESGQVYVSLRQEHKDLQLSLMTRKGITQDMILMCDANQLEAPLILENKEQDSFFEEPKEQSLLISLVRKSLEDSLEDSQKFQTNPIRYSSEDLIWRGTKYWEVGDYRVIRFEAKNKTEKIILLKTEDLKQTGDLIVSFDQDILEPGKKAVLVVVTEQSKKITPISAGEKNDLKIN